MDQNTPQSGAETPWRERRRRARVSGGIPVDVVWEKPDHIKSKEEAQAFETSVTGAALSMMAPPTVGTQLELTNRLSNEVAAARVIAIRPAEAAAVIVELAVPSETFWGIAFRLKKVTADLRTLENEIKSGGVDPRLLQELRDSVDHVRKTAWAVNE